MLRPGERLAGKYRVERLLGQGGMGAVFVAVNEMLDKRVALKVMTGGFATSPDAVQRFFREAMSASRVRHPAIVEIYDAGTHEGAPWMAMELLSGQSLAERLERGPLGLGEVLAIFGPVLGALDAVHQHGVVHRDLKPDNIFLEQLADGRMAPKLLDFGIAKTQDALNKLTATGTVMGTAHYLAPEQARDSSTVDPRTDLYAIGVVLYESLSGRMPHEASTLPELVAKLITEDPAPLLALAPHVPAQLGNVVHWCLARDPASRPQRAADLAAHLAHALAHVPPTPTVWVPSTPGARSSTGAASPAGGAALAAFGAAQGAQGPAHLPSTGGVGPTAGFGAAFGAAGSQGTAQLPPSIGGVGPTAAFGGGAGTSPPLGAFSPSPPPGSYPGSHGFGPQHPLASPARPPSRGTSGANKLLIAALGVVLLGTACLFVAPFAIAIFTATAVRGAGAGGGLGGLGSRFPRRWDTVTAPLLHDINGDGTTDLVGWHMNFVGYDLHYFLCAFDGRTGAELWCKDVGEQDSFGEARTVYIGDRAVFFDRRGRVTGVRLRDGSDVGYRGSVQGQPREICVTRDAIVVQTSDRLWTALRMSDGALSPAATEPPPGCGPARTSQRAYGAVVVTGDGDWTALAHGQRPRLRNHPLNVREAWQRTSTGETVVFGVAPAEGRSSGALAQVQHEDILWQVAVPVEPLMAQSQPPEAVALLGDTAFLCYEMTGRAGVPRRVAAFRLSDGARLWDVAVEQARGGQAMYLLGAPDLVVVATPGVVVGLDPGTGAVRFQVGEAY